MDRNEQKRWITWNAAENVYPTGDFANDTAGAALAARNIGRFVLSCADRRRYLEWVIEAYCDDMEHQRSEFLLELAMKTAELGPTEMEKMERRLEQLVVRDPRTV
jgi:hypothetical protein